MLMPLRNRCLLLLVFAISFNLLGQPISSAASTATGSQPAQDSQDSEGAVYLPSITNAEPQRIILAPISTPPRTLL